MPRKLFCFLLLAFCLRAQSPMVRGTSGSALVLLGKLASANMNTTADQAITIALPTGTTKYVVKDVIVANASTSLTLAVGGIYTAASKGGNALVANTQVYSGVTGSTKLVSATLAAVAGTDIVTATTLYLSLTTGQGGAATADVYIFGELLP